MSIIRLVLMGQRPGLMDCRPFGAETTRIEILKDSSPNGAAIHQPGASPRAVASGVRTVHGLSKPGGFAGWISQDERLGVQCQGVLRLTLRPPLSRRVPLAPCRRVLSGRIEGCPLATGLLVQRTPATPKHGAETLSKLPRAHVSHLSLHGLPGSLRRSPTAWSSLRPRDPLAWPGNTSVTRLQLWSARGS
jgi:hypothetical protein